jgi:hypothetical protein
VLSSRTASKPLNKAAKPIQALGVFGSDVADHDERITDRSVMLNRETSDDAENHTD